MQEKIEIKQWWMVMNDSFMKQLKKDYKPIICDINIGRKTYSIVYDGDGLRIKEWDRKGKTTNRQKFDAIQMTIEQARTWLFRMGFSRGERVVAAEALIHYCQGILRAEGISHDNVKR